MFFKCIFNLFKRPFNIRVFIHINSTDTIILSGINKENQRDEHDGIYIEGPCKPKDINEINKNSSHEFDNLRIFTINNAKSGQKYIVCFGRVNKKASFIVKENKTDYEVTI